MDSVELKKRRLKAGLTQSGLGKLLDISSDTVKSWELGRNPIQKIAGIALDTVLKEIEQEQERQARIAERHKHLSELASKRHGKDT